MAWRDIPKILFAGLTTEQQRSILVSLAAIAFTVHILHAYGVLPFDDGFVSTTQVEEIADRVAEVAADRTNMETLQYVELVEDSINELHTEILTERIENLQIQKCGAENQRLRNQFSGRINRNMAKYRELNGFDYRLTPCNQM